MGCSIPIISKDLQYLDQITYNMPTTLSFILFTNYIVQLLNILTGLHLITLIL